VQDGDGEQRGTRIRRRDRHGRGLRGSLAPAGVPLHRTRAERFDDLVLQAVARLEPRWEAQLAGVEFAVEEIPPAAVLAGPVRGPIPLSRLDLGLPRPTDGPAGEDATRDDLIVAGEAGKDGSRPAPAGPARARIVVYRRPLMARADGEDDLGELVFDVVVEEFARLVGLDPAEVDPGYSGED
jgi:predicted Zn-dependent protease with MMP-like domain